MTDQVSVLREFVTQEIRGTATVSFAIVDDVHNDRTVDVVLKHDENLVLTDLPVASVWARDGAGVVVPVEQGDEGLLLHPRKPIETALQERGTVDVDSRRHHQLEQAIFFPMLWLAEDDVPDHELDELTVVHDTGTTLRVGEDIVAEGGDLVVEGQDIVVEDGDVMVTDGDVEADGVSLKDHTHDFTYDGGGEGSTTRSGETDEPD